MILSPLPNPIYDVHPHHIYQTIQHLITSPHVGTSSYRRCNHYHAHRRYSIYNHDKEVAHHYGSMCIDSPKFNTMCISIIYNKTNLSCRSAASYLNCRQPAAHNKLPRRRYLLGRLLPPSSSLSLCNINNNFNIKPCGRRAVTIIRPVRPQMNCNGTV